MKRRPFFVGDNLCGKSVKFESMILFLIKNTFLISGRQSVVFEGEVISGVVEAGQRMKIKPTANHPQMEFTIASVEFVDHRAEKIANVGLMVKIESMDALREILGYGIVGEYCEIV